MSMTTLLLAVTMAAVAPEEEAAVPAIPVHLLECNLPPLSDRDAFWLAGDAYAAIRCNQQYRDYLQLRAALEPTFAERCQEANEEAVRLFYIWDALDDVQRVPGELGKRFALRRLRDRLGPARY